MSQDITSMQLEVDAWGKLTNGERREVAIWEEISKMLSNFPSKASGLQAIRMKYAGELQGLSRSAIYRKVSLLREGGAMALLGRRVERKLDASGVASRLPRAFVDAWHQRLGMMQRGKALSAWHRLMRDLIGGAVIPGYDKSWQGIWLDEHPGCIVPDTCPYVDDHRAGLHPRGWGYRNLARIRPGEDVMAGATRGVAALKAYLPSCPHTRVGLGLMRVVTMDDVWHDNEVLFLHGRQMPTHERPVEVGLMDVLTGSHVVWAVWPVLRREDGSRQMVDGSVQRYIQAALFCSIGVNPDGVIELLEHGTAGMDEREVERINSILSRYANPPSEQGAWLAIERSGTTGAPVTRGLFVERACGNPRHKAMLESSWNLLHNELGSLPAPVGRNRDEAPADAEGLRREDRALMRIVNQVSKESPAALEVLKDAEFHAVSFLKFKEALEAVKRAINARTDHSLEGWEGCGFTRTVAELPSGQRLELDALPPAQRASVCELVRTIQAPVSLRRLSPMEAFSKMASTTQLKRFPAAAAAEILGDELSQEVKVGAHLTITITDKFSREALTYVALATSETGRKVELRRGDTVRIWANPFARDVILVSYEGRVIGVCHLLRASKFADAAGDKRNLGLWQEAKSAQAVRLEPVLAGRAARASKVRADLSEVLERAHQAGITRTESPMDVGSPGIDSLSTDDLPKLALEDFI